VTSLQSLDRVRVRVRARVRVRVRVRVCWVWFGCWVRFRGREACARGAISAAEQRSRWAEAVIALHRDGEAGELFAQRARRAGACRAPGARDERPRARHHERMVRTGQGGRHVVAAAGQYQAVAGATTVAAAALRTPGVLPLRHGELVDLKVAKLGRRSTL
jgi:hypothetical protein